MHLIGLIWGGELRSLAQGRQSKASNPEMRTLIGFRRMPGMRGSEKLKDTVLYSYVLLGTVQLDGDGHIMGSPSMLLGCPAAPSAEPPFSKEALLECFKPVTWCLKVTTGALALLYSDVSCLPHPLFDASYQSLTASGHEDPQAIWKGHAEGIKSGSLRHWVWPQRHVSRERPPVGSLLSWRNVAPKVAAPALYAHVW